VRNTGQERKKKKRERENEIPSGPENRQKAGHRSGEIDRVRTAYVWPITQRPSGAAMLSGPYLSNMEETRVSWKLDIVLARGPSETRVGGSRLRSEYSSGYNTILPRRDIADNWL